MQQIKIKKLRMKNFRCYEETELDFPEDQLVAITGKNGKGKSSYLMALMVALYGRPVEALELSDLVNKKEGKNLEIILEFDIDDTSYEIRRYYKHSKYQNKLFLLKIDGEEQEDLSEKTVSDTYKKIESLLIPKQVFINSVYFSQQVKDFFTSLTDSKQKEIFEAILQLEEWKDYYQNSRIHIKLLEDEISILQSNIDKTELLIENKVSIISQLNDILENQKSENKKKLITSTSQLKQCQDALSKLESSIVEFPTKEYEDLISSISRNQDKIDNVDDDIVNVKNQIDQEKKLKIQELNLVISNKLALAKGEIEKKFSDAIKTSNESLGVVAEKIQQIQNRFANLVEINNSEIAVLTKDATQYENSLLNMKETVEKFKQTKLSLQNKLDEFTEDDDIICPTCFQIVKDEENIKHIDNAKLKIQNEISDIDKKLLEIKDNFEVVKQKLIQVKTKIISKNKEHNSNQSDTNDELKNLSKMRDELKIKITKYETDIDSAYKDAENKLNTQVVKKLNELNTLYATRAIEKEEELIKSVIDIKENIAKLKENKNKLQSLKERQELIQIQMAEVAETIKQRKIDIEECQKELFDPNIPENENQLESLKDELKTIKESLDFKQEELEISKFWKLGFSDKGIPSMLIDAVIPDMNSNISKELELIAPGKYIVSFDTMSATKSGDIREKFSVNILNTETGSDSHSQLSGGEKRQIDVCCMRVLRLLAEELYGKRFNITLLDEVLDSLDSDNASLFCQHLKMLSKNCNITLITHSMLQDAECDKVLSL